MQLGARLAAVSHIRVIVCKSQLHFCSSFTTFVHGIRATEGGNVQPRKQEMRQTHNKDGKVVSQTEAPFLPEGSLPQSSLTELLGESNYRNPCTIHFDSHVHINVNHPMLYDQEAIV